MHPSTKNTLIALLSEGQIKRSQLSKTAKPLVEQFVSAKVLKKQRSGNGVIYTLLDSGPIKKYLEATGYHGPTEHLTPKGQAVANYGDAHAGKGKTLIFHLSATDTVWWYNHGEAVYLSGIIDDCGMASIAVHPEDKWTTNHPIALVENLDLLVYADKYFENIPFKGNIMYYAGWVSSKAIEWLKQQENPPDIIFPDYDLVGLNNYLKLKEIFPEIKLYIPDGLEDLFRRFGSVKRLKTQRGKDFTVNPGKDKDVQYVYSLILKYGKCLDQESLLLDQNKRNK